jgi:aspartyl-tRNA synthetase
MFNEEKVPQILFQKAIRELLNDKGFDYQSYFKEHTIPEEKIEACIEEVIKENPELARDIREGSTKKAGILVGKVLAKTG